MSRDALFIGLCIILAAAFIVYALDYTLKAPPC